MMCDTSTTNVSFVEAWWNADIQLVLLAPTWCNGCMKVLAACVFCCCMQAVKEGKTEFVLAHGMDVYQVTLAGHRLPHSLKRCSTRS